MNEKKSSFKYPSIVSISNLIFIEALVVFLAALGSAQSNDVILAAPGQAVTDSIMLGGGSHSDISITLPTFPPLDLNPENSHYEVTRDLGVSSSGNWLCGWSISVSSDTSGGSLAEYDPAATYVSGGKKLQNPMRITAVGSAGGREVDLSSGGVLIDSADAPSGPVDKIIPVTLIQDVTWQDQPLQNGHVYHMEISFIGSVYLCLA